MKICILGCLDDLLLMNTGAPVRIYNLAKCLSKSGHEVHIILPTPLEAFEWTEGVTVHGVKGLLPRALLTFFSKLLGVSNWSSLFLYDPSFIAMSGNIILRSDVVQTESPSLSTLVTLFARLVYRKPIITDSHDVFQVLRVQCRSNVRRILEAFLEKVTYRFSSLVLTVSEKDKDLLLEYGVPGKKIRTVPNGVDTDLFSPLADSSHFTSHLPNVPFRVIFVGNMEYAPNEEAAKIITSRIAPRILSQMHNVEFLVVGRHKDAPKQMPANIAFTGVVKNVVDYLTTSNVAIAPLLQGSGTRLKILEYFSCGLPVVSTSIGAEGLDTKNGVNIFIEDDLEKFAARVVELLSNETLCSNIGNAARELVLNKYDWRIVGKELDKICTLLYHGKSTR